MIRILHHILFCFLAKKKSLKSNKTDKGLKWFKGSPKKSPNKLKVPKVLQKEEPAQPLSSLSRVVEFEIEGSTERVGVVEPLELIEKVITTSNLTVTVYSYK